MKLPIFKECLILRLPSDFSWFGKTKTHDFHLGLFSLEVASLFEKQTILFMQSLFLFHLIWNFASCWLPFQNL